MSNQSDLSQLSDTSLHALLDENQGNPLGTQILQELLSRESTIEIKPGFDVDELRKQLQREH